MLFDVTKISMSKQILIKTPEKPLGLLELIALALGGMIGGGIFSILGVSVEKIGNATPIAIMIGGILALLSAYPYARLALYYKDEGATYSFYKKTFSNSHFSASVMGWFIVFGYISTLSLYAFTFASYLSSVLPPSEHNFMTKIIAGAVLLFFTLVNLASVKGMGKLEDVIVYTKLIILLVISVLLGERGSLQNIIPVFNGGFHFANILIVSALTFVAYEGFQLVISATKETNDPDRSIPRAMYSAISIATFLYVILAIGALLAIPKVDIISGKEYALASGAGKIFGRVGLITVILGAMLATSSAINGTLFGASRLMGVIADDGYFPKFLTIRIKKYIPKYALLVMFILAYILVLSGSLEVILKFGSMTFLLTSFLMAYANFRICDKTKSSAPLTLVAMFALAAAFGFILFYEFTTDIKGLLFIVGIYLLLAIFALIYARTREKKRKLDILIEKIKPDNIGN